MMGDPKKENFIFFEVKFTLFAGWWRMKVRLEEWSRYIAGILCSTTALTTSCSHPEFCPQFSYYD